MDRTLAAQHAGATYVKSSYSERECVEVAVGASTGIRDSKDPERAFEVTGAAWAAFLGTLKR
ncbi:DUF397 domain-containing protein [Streptomyces sp. URMC 129]|uniref:DUF397 domain-containing protein n=1 Tax=Streptomyces sp. URMC 129 TaxID=3423407 RepID=UPI003F19D059